MRSVFGCWYCKNHGLSFIPFYSSPISPFKVNLRLFGSMSLLLSYLNKLHLPVQPGMRCREWGSPGDLVTCVTAGWGLQLSDLGWVGERPWPQLRWLQCAPCLAFGLTWCISFMRPWDLRRKLSSWASENPRYKLFLFLWALWPWICAVARNNEQPPGFIHKRCTFCPSSGSSSPKRSPAGVCSSLDALLLCLPMPSLLFLHLRLFVNKR